MKKRQIRPAAPRITEEQVLTTLKYIRRVLDGLIAIVAAGGTPSGDPTVGPIYDRNCPPPPIIYEDCYGDPTEAGSASQSATKTARRTTRTQRAGR